MLLHYLTTGSCICDYRWLLHPHLLSSIWYHHPTPAQREECIRSDQKDFSFKLNTISAKASKGFSVAPLDPWKQPSSFPAHEEVFSCISAMQRTRNSKTKQHDKQTFPINLSEAPQDTHTHCFLWSTSSSFLMIFFSSSLFYLRVFFQASPVHL